MNDIVIDIRDISKRYFLSHQHRPESIKTWLSGLVTRAQGLQTDNDEEFWALKNVTLQIRQGECLALVGNNGSGKSTLLKILSRVVPPTSGRIVVHGRIASLLEVGTGFHPELTGRENIFLNGALLGCSELELRRRFDAIVDFSGVERFLDTPVKHYSNGMYVRLAYSVAAHVDADIQVIDEVLSVGDEEFQAKCIENLSQQAKAGRTIIFVTHSHALQEHLSTRIATLTEGRLDSQNID